MVTQITDASGRVLWKSGPSEATVTITGSGGNANMVWVTINGVDYREATSVNVPIGTVITCNPYGSVILNGQTVANGQPITYDYTVTKNVTINLNWKQGSGTITITEIPEGHALVQITGTGNISFGTYITIDGVDYTTAQNKTFSIGTVITCYAKLNSTDSFGEIRLNGLVQDKDYDGEGITYAYTLNGNTIIELITNKGGGSVYITEQ